MTEFQRLQKNIVKFCNYLQPHVDEWKSLLQESSIPVIALCNQADQLRHIENVNLNTEDFKERQKTLQYNILVGIEEDIQKIKRIISQLSCSNARIIDILKEIECHTLDIDWDCCDPVIMGSPTQPALITLLSEACEFVEYFTVAACKIENNFKTMDLRNEKSMTLLENSFKIDLEVKAVSYVIALTQYIDNKNNIV